MGPGPGEIETTSLNPRRGRASQAEDSEYEYKSLDELRKKLPDRLDFLPSSDIVPACRSDVEGQRIQELARCVLGGDGNVYVVRYRDTYKKRLIGKNELVSQEAAVAYQGKSLEAAAAAMNAAQVEFSESGTVPKGTLMTVGGATATG